MKPIFTIHAGEFLVGCEIEKKFRHLNIWMPTRDTGIDLLVSNKPNTKTISLQVKFSRDYLVTDLKKEIFTSGLRACGWWTPTRKQIEESCAQYWVFVLIGFANRSADFIVIKPQNLLKRLNQLQGRAANKFHIYFWVTKKAKCYETRNLINLDRHAVAEGRFDNNVRDFTPYLNNWKPVAALNS